ncbi:latent-transforming growth factor beta-binding protein 4 isoform X1 [Oncorhynchus kisutch]|uniref:Latent-transforming growth factor beta-binding protein 4 n=1 Tax=Oncorhynchus kisutch TaxID=8019 RepID=A0A8C7KW27_ONCKI|nr:latent-transforming growth factor beta-binding protein 4 isoform X1 [Oncorhynchus kisutch]
MSSRRYANLFVLGVAFIFFLTFSKLYGTLVRRSTHKRAHETQRRTASRYHHTTVNYHVYHTQRKMQTTSKPTLKQKQFHFNGKKHWKYATNVTLQLNGPNVCGNRCCHGWTVSLKTQKCTKPRCLPRCHNGAVCRQPNICECRTGFYGARCEFASVTYGLVGLPWALLRPTSPMVSTTTSGLSITLSPTTSLSPTITLPPTTVIPTTTTPVSAETTAAWRTAGTPASTTNPETKKYYAVRWQPLTLQEAQLLLLKKALARGGRGDKMTTILMKHIEKERKKLQSASQSDLQDTQTTSVKSFHTQKGQYTVHAGPPAASNQTAGHRGGTAAGAGRRGAERIKVLFTPTICKVRCTQGRCTNFCEQGNVTTLYNSEQGGRAALGPGFRVFLCPMLCQNGGVCIQKDRCLCPPTFTGKFCHIPVATPSTNDIEKPPRIPSVLASQQLLTQSEYILPLQSHSQPSGASGSSMVKVRVQHPPEASVKIHQVLKVGYGPGTVREQSETVTWSAGLSGARTSVLPGERAEAPPPKPRVQAQTLHGDSTYTESSGFKYCFREVRNGQCSSPLPGLRSQDTCCRGIGLAWGINECVLCPPNTGNGVDGSCPAGFERINGTQCVDVNECLQPGFCENGNCVNTRGSYSCVCRQGYILDASHGICISRKVISEDKGQCYRILNSGSGRGSCSVPILRNITKQICCCSRVGKAWGKNCERCPYFGSVAFKEICPAGPGYHYSASAIKFNQRVVEQHGTGGPPVISQSTPQTRPQQPASSGAQTPQTSPQQPSSSGFFTPQTRPQQPDGRALIPQTRPQQPSSGGSLSPQGRPHIPAISVTAGPTRVVTARTPTQTKRPPVDQRPISPVRPAQPLPSPVTPRPPIPRPVRGVCETMPQVCGQGRCVDQPGGRHTCICYEGYQHNAQQTHCQDIDECRASPPPCSSGRCQNTEGGYRCSCPSGYQPGPRGTSCIDVNECIQAPSPCSVGECENTPGRYRCVCPAGFRANFQQTQCQDIDECRQVPNPCNNGRCENSPGSFKCVCRTGYKLEGNTCKDVDECEDPLKCPGQACVNSPGSYKCVSCPPGFGLLNEQCRDVDECRQTPSLCTNGRCENTPGSYRCVCHTGYKLQGKACTDVDECEDPLRCPGQACVNSQGSYNCVSCKPGFSMINGQCSDIDECRQSPGPCTNGHCENTQGSYSCACLTGYRLYGDTCTDADECADPSQCPGQECVNSQGSYKCVSCKPGFGLVDRRCTDVDECLHSPTRCANGRCENTAGSYKCACRSGFRLQGNTCTDVNECENALQCPGQECINSEGSFICVACSPGFVAGNGQCTDIDECRQTSNLCANGLCENTLGSYRCVCRTGFKLQGSVCIDVDECADSSQCPGQRCVNSEGSYKCIACKAGHRMQDGLCADVDECQSPDTCGAARLCVNTDGSYRCDCQPGYRTTGLGRQCRDVNECLEGEYCFPRGECVNTEGSYRCVCSQGYTTSSDGSSCLDVDECARSGPGVCQDGRCVNTEGSYQCQCQVGFTTNPEKTACLDVDECSEGAVCRTQRCENTIGSYRCITSCEPGYRVTRTGECVDINECANETVCGEHAFCQNLIGTYQCMCDQGYTATSDGKGCVDENECETMQGVCGAARCENVDGSFMCECPGEGEEFDTRSGQCLSTPRPGLPVFSGGSSSSSSTTGLGPQRRPDASQLPPARPGELRECYYNTEEQSSCSVLARNTTQQECCCTVGQGWGMGCQFDPCPQLGTAEHQALCPSGRGYVTGPGAFSYKDVDECKLFHPEVCKSGVCVNNIPGYSCYCTSGYYYDNVFLECIDVDECEAGEDSCPGGICVNTLGSHFCTCVPPLVLDDTQRSCVNSTGLAVDEKLSFCWQYVTPDLVCQSPLLGGQVTFTECCCLYGEGWGLQCALCPARDSEDYEARCNVFLRPPEFPPPFPDRYGPDPGPVRGGGGGYRVPYGPDSFPDPIPRRPEYPRPDYDDYTPPGGSRSGFRGRTPSTFRVPESPYRRPSGYIPERYYDEDDYGPPDAPPRPPFRTLPDPRSELSFGARPPLPIPEGLPLSLAPLPDSDPYSEEEEEGPEPWRVGPPFPDRRGPGGAPRRVYERQYEPYAGLSTEDCGILHGCENGRCIRVVEGYTCDCYEGYELDMTSMACIDINECEVPDSVCVSGRCINTDGSYRCVCHRGYVMSRRPNHCVAA